MEIEYLNREEGYQISEISEAMGISHSALDAWSRIEGSRYGSAPSRHDSSG